VGIQLKAHLIKGDQGSRRAGLFSMLTEINAEIIKAAEL